MRARNWRSRVITGIPALAVIASGVGVSAAPAEAAEPYAVIATPAPAAEPYAVSTISSFQDPTEVAMAPDGKVLYVANSEPVANGVGGSASQYGISVVSTATNTITRTIVAPSFDQPVAVALSPNGAYLYVLNYEGEVSVVSTTSDTVTATIGVQNDNAEASDIVISPNGATGYISEEGIGVVSVLNLSTHLVTRTITGSTPTLLALSPNGKTLYAVSGGSTVFANNILVIDLATGTVTDTIKLLDEGLAGIAVSRNGSDLYAVDQDQVDVIATATDSIASTITGIGPAFSQLGNVALSPNGSTLYVGGPDLMAAIDLTGNADTVTTVSISNGDTAVDSVVVTPDGDTVYALTSGYVPTPLTVINAKSDTVSGAVPTVGNEPAAMVVSPDGSEVYVTNSTGVSVISPATQTATRVFNIGFQPAGIALSPNGKTLYLTDASAGTVAVLNAATGAVTGTVNLGGGPAGVAFSPNGKTAYVATSGDTIAVVDVATGFAVNLITVNNDPSSVAVSPNGKTLYAGSPYDGLDVVDVATGKVSKTVSASSGVLALNPDGKTLYAAYSSISAINTANNAIVKTFGPDNFVWGLAVSPGGGTLYAAAANTVSVISTSTYVTTTITDPSFGGNLEGVAVTPNGKAVYIADTDNNAVQLLTPQKVPAKITSRASATFTVGKKGSFEVTTSGYPTAATITESGTLPKGVTFKNNKNGTATLSGTPAAKSGKVYTVTIKATNGVGKTASQSFKLTVDQAAAITSAATATFTYHKKGSFEITTTGYPAAATITESGSLPKGVAFKNNKNGTATLFGTPDVDASKTYTITIKASNGVGSAVTQKFKLILKKL